jgi:signal peptidase II
MKRFAVVAAVVAVTVGADQLTKHLAASGQTVVVEGIFELHRTEHTASVWTASLRGLPESIRRPVLLGASALAIAFLLFLVVRQPERQATALAFVVGGATGNFADHLFRGHVVSFIQLHYRDFAGLRWPAFNLADVAIFLGLGLLVRELLKRGALHGDGQGLTPGQA